MRQVLITLTVEDEARTPLRMPVSNLIRYEPMLSGEATFVVYADEKNAVRTALVREPPLEVARLVWAALRPAPISTSAMARNVVDN